MGELGNRPSSSAADILILITFIPARIFFEVLGPPTEFVVTSSYFPSPAICRLLNSVPTCCPVNALPDVRVLIETIRTRTDDFDQGGIADSS